MKANKLLTAISAVAISVGASQVNAQELQPGIFQVAANSEVKIDRHGTCRVVKNTGNNPVMIPTNTVQEWASGANSFLTNIANMSGISAGSCGLSPAIYTEFEFCTAMSAGRGGCMGRGSARMGPPRPDGAKTVIVTAHALIGRLGTETTTCIVDGSQGDYILSNDIEIGGMVFSRL